jgi:hypothetical protein
VNDTYQHVYNTCWDQFGVHARFKIWLKPTRAFTSSELATILAEASAVGTAVRDDARARGGGSCGWVWLALDPDLLKHIHKLRLDNVRTNFTTMLMDDYRLYLEDIYDHNHMSATYKGMAAAAEVLARHGIRSTLESMAD